MGRIGVEFEQVKEAAEGLEAAGEAPTIERVRRVLGQGSFSTLGRHLKTWRLLRQQDHQAGHPMPDAITEAAQGLWVGLSEAARRDLEAFRENAEQEALAQEAQARQALTDVQAQLGATLRERDAGTERVASLQAQLTQTEEAARGAFVTHTRAMGDVQQRLAATLAEKEVQHQLIQKVESQLEATRASHKATLETLKAQAEQHGVLEEQRHQERLARERAQAEAEQRHEKHVTALTTALERAEARQAEASKQVHERQREASEVKEKAMALSHDLSAQKKDNAHLMQALESLRQRDAEKDQALQKAQRACESLQRDMKALQDKQHFSAHEQLFGALEALEKRVAALPRETTAKIRGD